MKRNKALRIAAILLSLVLISTCAMTGTLAKYATKFENLGSDVIRAGIFKVTGPADATEIELTATLLDGDMGAEDEAESYGGDLGIIVPGSVVQLSAEFKVVNLSEVTVEIAIDEDSFAIGDFGSALLYSVTDEEDWMDLASFLAAVDFDDVLTSTGADLTLEPIAGEETFTVAFDVLWPFAADSSGNDGEAGHADSVDTGFGEDEASQISTGTFIEDPTNVIDFTLTVFATQVD